MARQVKVWLCLVPYVTWVELAVLGVASRIRRLWQVDYPEADATYPQRAVLYARD